MAGISDKPHLAAMLSVVITIIIAVGFLLFLDNLIKASVTDYSKMTVDARSMLGKKVVVIKDTATIVDFSTFRHSFILSDGREIDQEYAKKNIVKDRYE